jgi:CubicO group peptidase (beta-lactamase class C family)
VSGQPFEQFMQAEVTGPLGLPSLHWSWTPELMAAAPASYGPQQEALGFRQLASQAIGSELGTVPDFARFVAAAVSGPNGEPVGRGVLAPDSLAKMTAVQPGATNEGLGYGISYTNPGSGALLQHFGGNAGWNAFFTIDTARREGLVMANNSANGFPLDAAVQNLWLSVLGGGSTAFEPAPEAETLPLQDIVMLALAGLLALALLISLLVLMVSLRQGRQAWTRRPRWGGLVGAGIWLLLALFWLYWFYTSLPLFFPPAFPDFWHTPQVDLVMAALLAWLVFSGAAAWVSSKKQVTNL